MDSSGKDTCATTAPLDSPARDEQQHQQAVTREETTVATSKQREHETIPVDLRDTRMEVLGATKYGHARSVLKFITGLPLPEAGPSEVRIRVSYAEINPVDVKKLNAKPAYTTTPGGLLVVGYGGSGFIDKVGDCVTNDNEGDYDSTANGFRKEQRVVFLCDPNKAGCFATHVVVNQKLVRLVPEEFCDERRMAQDASIPVAGCAAYEALEKVGLSIGIVNEGILNGPPGKRTLLIVGGAGGVGSWTALLARAVYPSLHMICTASTEKSSQWCTQRLGATDTVSHSDIETLGGGREGSVDHIVCLTEPTQELFASLTEVLRPHGKICLVESGNGIKSLDLSFVFFKSGTVATETVFSSCRNGYLLDQAAQMGTILSLMSSGRISGGAPLAQEWEDVPGARNWKMALNDKGVFDKISTGHCQGKLVMKIGYKDE